MLDFVGHHRTEFRFDRRFRALLGGTRRDVERAVAARLSVPARRLPHELDRVATEIVLASLREAIPSRWPAKVEELRELRTRRTRRHAAEFLAESGLELDDVYDGAKTWSDLREDAGLRSCAAGPDEKTLRRAAAGCSTSTTTNGSTPTGDCSRSRAPDRCRRLSPRERRLLRMLVASVADQAITEDHALQEAVDLFWAHPQVRAELLELLDVLDDRVDHVHRPLRRHPDVPLQVHARYTRLEILAAFGIGDGAKVAAWQSGVYEAKDANADLFAFTLDKSSGSFSPTTRYRDYAISRDAHPLGEPVDHPRRQRRPGCATATTRRDGTIDHAVRAAAQRRPGVLVPRARHLRGHVGELPMAITWELHTRCPAICSVVRRRGGLTAAVLFAI